MKISYEQHNAVPNLSKWIRRLILSWLLAAGVEYLLLSAELRNLSGLSCIAAMSSGRMILVACAVFAAVCAIQVDAMERWLIAAAFAFLAVLSLAVSFTWPLLIACLLILAVLVVYALRGWNGDKANTKRCQEQRGYGWLAAGGAVFFFLLVSIWTVCRVRSFSTPSYDFGIFAQMFHSMKTTGLPMTTIERDGPLSHFAVHMSPIYYLLLPFYWLAPAPATLQVLQAAVLTSALIPLWKLGKHHGIAPMPRAVLCLVMLLYPAYAGGTSYDVHENAFLTPLILWLFYGIDRKNAVVTTIFAVLTLMVKEDAAVYVAVIALYLLLRSMLHREKWGMIAGGVMLLGAVAYFAAVTRYLSESGDGVMTYRYRNFMYDDSDSLLTVIKAVLLCPMKAIYESVDREKLEFIGLTMLPLAGLPLLTRRYERFLLLIPYVLVNLMSDYQYQHDIFFQYTYGSTACLVYLALVNLADMKIDTVRLTAFFAALCVSAACFGAQILPIALRYPDKCITYRETYDELRTALDTVPVGASVAATTYYTTHLSQRDVLYDVRYASKEHVLSCDFVAVNENEEKSFKAWGGFEEFEKLLQRNGYQLIVELEGRLKIYQKV
ncbi:MAG: DUF2079 domain-containing protein [Oscillospiraceae bacterium]|nr:DUF2079 domain-containing protein [Oscillospiraceae bacterium]